jgi:hypothetical protein
VLNISRLPGCPDQEELVPAAGGSEARTQVLLAPRFIDEAGDEADPAPPRLPLADRARISG